MRCGVRRRWLQDRWHASDNMIEQWKLEPSQNYGLRDCIWDRYFAISPSSQQNLSILLLRYVFLHLLVSSILFPPALSQNATRHRRPRIPLHSQFPLLKWPHPRYTSGIPPMEYLLSEGRPHTHRIWRFHQRRIKLCRRSIKRLSCDCSWNVRGRRVREFHLNFLTRHILNLKLKT